MLHDFFAAAFHFVGVKVNPAGIKWAVADFPCVIFVCFNTVVIGNLFQQAFFVFGNQYAVFGGNNSCAVYGKQFV